MPTEAARVLRLLQGITSTLCVACLAKIIALPLPAMRIITADLLASGVLTWAPSGRPCQACGKPPALQAKGAPQS